MKVKNPKNQLNLQNLLTSTIRLMKPLLSKFQFAILLKQMLFQLSLSINVKLAISMMMNSKKNKILKSE